MQKHFRGHVADFLPIENGIPHQPGSAAKIESHRTKTIVHGQAEAVTFYASLVAQSPGDGLTESDAGIFDGMMLIDVEVAFAAYHQIHARVPGNLVEHVVEKSYAGRYIATAVPVEIQVYLYIGFGRGAAYLGTPFPGKKELRNTVPVIGNEGTDIFEMRLLDGLSHRRVTIEDTPATEVTRQEHIGDAVSDDKGSRHIVTTVEIGREHGRTGFARGQVFFGERTVDVYGIESHPFAFESLQHLIVSRPESLLGKRRSTQSVLIGDHDQLEIELLTDIGHVAEHLGYELQLFEAVELIIDRGFYHQRPVTVDEEHAFAFVVHNGYDCRVSINMRSSCGVPTVMRRQFSQSLILLRLRTMIPRPTK